MSTRELQRAGVLARVKAKTLSLASAAALMAVSLRQAKRLYRRYREEGAAGVQHRSVGRPSNRKGTFLTSLDSCRLVALTPRRR